MKKDFFYCFVAAALAFGLTLPLMKGGSRTASLKGEVTDPSGAVVPGAKILIANDHWSATFSSNGSGDYEVKGLAPGAYNVTVSSHGFAPFARAVLVISAGDRIEMDANLNLPTVVQRVTVTAGGL